ncbi:hypothetical protein [Streptomyces sp. SP18CS02]|uniref:hypothetical protein n=1 Tax=Streptomyces sp. SP18CS02 TaxID=3002531 RepID=UPI002E766A5E|nr:hypothetical protein [Streptomyces sp. SP18CS02]MEE1756918.1 hypothetical protein [Streptomyces sp. SP18CS02]
MTGERVLEGQTLRPAARTAAAAWSACAAFAAVLAVVSDIVPHRVWGAVAAGGYAAAALLAGRRHRRAAAITALLGAAVAPLVLLVASGRGQLEVAVVERSGALLAATGSPYADAPGSLAAYNPYLPGMALLGLLPGDPRWWMGAVLVAALAVTRPPLHALANPLVALPLAVGGVDLPVVGLMCLGLALAGRGRAGGAGLVLGLAAALKWTAWPALPVALALLAVRARRAAPPRRAGDRWPAVRCGLAALTVAGALVVPAALLSPAAFHENVIAFPLGLTPTASPAATPFPGHLLAAHVPGGTVVAAVLLAVSAVLLGLSLLVRPPATVPAAARRLALGLTLAIALMPATRFGYLVHPFVLLTCLGGLHAPHARRHQ